MGIVRLIHFFRVDCGQEAGQPRPFNPEPYFKKINQLNWAQGERYLEHAPGQQLCCWVDDHPKNAIRARFAVVRRDAYPSTEASGTVGQLTLKDGEGLAELTHAVFFPNRIVGIEFNHFGPRAGRIANYINEKGAAKLPQISLIALAHHDKVQLLRDAGSLRAIEIKMHCSQVSEQSKLGDLKAAIDAANAANSKTVTFSMSAPRGESLFAQATRWATQLLKSDGVKRLKVRPLEGDVIDLLGARIAIRAEITARGKTPKGAAVYSAIEKAYEDNHKTVLESAEALELLLSEVDKT